MEVREEEFGEEWQVVIFDEMEMIEENSDCMLQIEVSSGVGVGEGVGAGVDVGKWAGVDDGELII